MISNTLRRFTSNDVRERSFQNVIDNILKPSGIKVGGFPEEIFLDLTDKEKETLICNICFLIVNECRQCENKHSFCRACIVAWSLTLGENAHKCPMCRCDQVDYTPDLETDKILSEKNVKCLEEHCGFRAPLRIFLMHSHGKAKYSNTDVDFEKLRRERAPALQNAFIVQLNSNNPAEPMQDHVLQGHIMLHQMMMLMNLELQLHQQALVSSENSADPLVRTQRLDDIMALNEQLNEVNSILPILLAAPMNRNNAANPMAARRAVAVATPAVTSSVRNTFASNRMSPALEPRQDFALPRQTAFSNSVRLSQMEDASASSSSEDDDDVGALPWTRPFRFHRRLEESSALPSSSNSSSSNNSQSEETIHDIITRGLQNISEMDSGSSASEEDEGDDHVSDSPRSLYLRNPIAANFRNETPVQNCINPTPPSTATPASRTPGFPHSFSSSRYNGSASNGAGQHGLNLTTSSFQNTMFVSNAVESTRLHAMLTSRESRASNESRADQLPDESAMMHSSRSTVALPRILRTSTLVGPHETTPVSNVGPHSVFPSRETVDTLPSPPVVERTSDEMSSSTNVDTSLSSRRPVAPPTDPNIRLLNRRSQRVSPSRLSTTARTSQRVSPSRLSTTARTSARPRILQSVTSSLETATLPRQINQRPPTKENRPTANSIARSTSNNRATTSRQMVPIPHPTVVMSRRSSGARSTALPSSSQTSRPRRRSEVAQEMINGRRRAN